MNELAINDESQTIVFQSVGNYEIEMSATDEAGNASNTKVAIKVVDKTIPIITGGTDIFLIGEGDSTVEPLLNLTAHDEIDGDLTAKIQIDDSQVKYGQMGTYQIVATVVDSSENECTQSFDVVIKDTTAPTLSLTTSSFTLTEGDSAPNYAGIASASDNVDGNITSSSSNSNSGSGQVMITRTGECYHTHKCGNGTYFWVSLQEAKNRGLRACQKCY